MGYTSNGLPNGGKTHHYHIEYDNALSAADGLQNALGLQAACEDDFTLMQYWFGGINVSGGYPIPVRIANASYGAKWHTNTLAQNSVTLAPGTGAPVAYLRYLLVSEVTEMFMATQDSGWFQGSNEGSKGEALSLFLAVQFQIVNDLGSAPLGGTVMPLWLNGGRQNYVDNNPDDAHHDQVTGCTTAFIYYLHDQLGFSVNQIVAAAASNLSGVYRHLTGRTDAWASFIDLVNSHYPPGMSYNPIGDSLFPVSELSAFFTPNPITTGYSEQTQVCIDRPAMAEVVIELSSSDPSTVSVPTSVTIGVGQTTAQFTITAPPLPIPFAPKSVTITASYAGKSLQINVEVVSPTVGSLVISPASVQCGNSATATVTLSETPVSGSGDAWVDVASSTTAFATVAQPQVRIPENGQSATFAVNTPNIQTPFSPAQVVITASYAGHTAAATLWVTPSLEAGILQSLVLVPPSVTGGETALGKVALESPVGSDTLVGLAVSYGGSLPKPGPGPTIASVQPTVTIPATEIGAEFHIRTQPLPSRESRTVTVMAGAVVTKYARLTVTS